ncbi:hypothetical protein HZS_49 [Henneguya salminicola]|nr:hypothetical protein HZS_49 [Henneguya salminicola]
MSSTLFPFIMKFRVTILRVILSVFRSPTQIIQKFLISQIAELLYITDQSQFEEFISQVNGLIEDNKVMFDQNRRLSVDIFNSLNMLPSETIISEKWTKSLASIVSPQYSSSPFQLPRLNKSFDSDGRYIGNQLEIILTQAPIIEKSDNTTTIKTIIKEQNIANPKHNILFPPPVVQFSQTTYQPNVVFKTSGPIEPFSFPPPRTENNSNNTFTSPLSSLTPFKEKFNISKILSTTNFDALPIPQIDTSLFKFGNFNFPQISTKSKENNSYKNDQEVKKISEYVLDTVIKELLIKIGDECLSEYSNFSKKRLYDYIICTLREYNINKYLIKWYNYACAATMGGNSSSRLFYPRKRFRDTTPDIFALKFIKSFNLNSFIPPSISFWWEEYLISDDNKVNDLFNDILSYLEPGTNLNIVPFVKILFIFPDAILSHKLAFKRDTTSFILMLWSKLFYYGIVLSRDEFKNIQYDEQKIIIHKGDIKICFVSLTESSLSHPSFDNLETALGANAVFMINSVNINFCNQIIAKNLKTILYPQYYCYQIEFGQQNIQDTALSIFSPPHVLNCQLKNSFEHIITNAPFIPRFIEKRLVEIINSEVLIWLIEECRNLSLICFDPLNIDHTTNCIFEAFNKYFKSVIKLFSSKIYNLPINYCDAVHCPGIPSEKWNDKELIKTIIHTIKLLKFPKIISPLYFNYSSEALNAIIKYIELYYKKIQPQSPSNYSIIQLIPNIETSFIKKIGKKFCIIVNEMLPSIFYLIMNRLCSNLDQELNIKVWIIEKELSIAYTDIRLMLKNLINDINDNTKNSFRTQQSPNNITSSDDILAHINYINNELSLISTRRQ